MIFKRLLEGDTDKVERQVPPAVRTDLVARTTGGEKTAQLLFAVSPHTLWVGVVPTV